MAEQSQTKKQKEIPMEKSEKSKKIDMSNMSFIVYMNEDLLHNILSRLPAKSFAFASCVNRSWNSLCNRIISRPKIISAFSRNPDRIKAGEEALDKVLSEPIRPDFVIANITCEDMDETLTMITKRVGSKVPIIVSEAYGVLGKEACNGKAGEFKLDVTSDANVAILLTIGYLPGMKVDVIPVIQAKGESKAIYGDKFVMDIRNYVSEVSEDAAPACLILFAEDTLATEPILRKLDYAMPAETVIVGDQSGEFIYRCADESRNVKLQKDDYKVLAGLIIARDRLRPSQTGRIQFHTAISRGMSPVDLMYKAVNVSASPRINMPVTLLTAKRRGEADVLDGEEILDDIQEYMLGNPIGENDLHIGVIKRRKYSIGLENMKPKIMSSLVFHEVSEADDQYLVVEGGGIKTGDNFQVYFPDLKLAESSLSSVSSHLRDFNACGKKTEEVVGGFVFASSGRGDSFFGRPSADGSPFLENFPELPFGGIFCHGEIGRNSIISVEPEEEAEEAKQEILIRRYLHVYSSVYLIVTYTSSSSSS